LEKWARHLAVLKAGKQADVVQLPKKRDRVTQGEEAATR
jgi:hypothetical protein